MRSTWSVCFSIYCPRSQSVSHIMPTWPECIPHNAMWSECLTKCPCCQCLTICSINLCGHMVSMFQYILPMWSECIPHNAHVVIVSHNMLYQSMRSTWSVCFGMYCPRGQSVSHIMPAWSECLTICCINPCCPHSQYVSPHNAHVVRVYPA
jgi:hypothetical protein